MGVGEYAVGASAGGSQPPKDVAGTGAVRESKGGRMDCQSSGSHPSTALIPMPALSPCRLPARLPALHPQVMLQDAVAAVALMESSSCPLQEGPLVGGMASSSSASAAALGDVLAGGGGGGSGSQPFLKDPDVQYAAVEAALLAALRGGGVIGGNLLLGFGGGGGSGDWG